MPPEVVKVEGLTEFKRKLKALDGHHPKEVRLILNDAAELIVTSTKGVIPRRKGKAAASVRAASTQTKGRVKAGGGRVPYYPWLDFGGSVGKGGSIKRPFLKSGRYLYKSLDSNRSKVLQRMAAGLDRGIKKAGL
jgi:hypothetical protein